MHCREFREEISEQIKNRNFPVHTSELARHMRECDLCRTFFEDAVLTQALRQMPTPEPDEQFAGRVIRKAVNRHRPNYRKLLFMGSSAAAALIFAVFAVFMFKFTDAGNHSGGLQTSAVVVPAGPENMVRILIEAAQSRPGVTLSIDLEGNIGLKNRPGRRRFQWQTKIAEGKNLLELPLEFQGPAGGHVKVGYRYDGVEKEMRIQVQPRSESSSRDVITS